MPESFPNFASNFASNSRMVSYACSIYSLKVFDEGDRNDRVVCSPLVGDVKRLQADCTAKVRVSLCVSIYSPFKGDLVVENSNSTCESGNPTSFTHLLCLPLAPSEPLALSAPASSSKTPVRQGLACCEALISSFGSACRFLFDVPAYIGGATLLGASKIGASLRVHPKGYEKHPACIYFRFGATGSSTGAAMNFVNE